jgi:hypothetical protein
MGLSRQVVGVFGVALACCACGSGDDEDERRASGVVTAEWSAFCTATFTEDYELIDVFDEPQFVAKKGEKYLLGDYSDSFGASAELIYLWPEGPEALTIEVASEADFPFTSSCPLNGGVPYYGVFENTAVYADEALTTKLCDLTAGTALPRTSDLSGYSIAGDLELFGPIVYEVYLNAFSAQCGASTGYVKVEQAESFTSSTWFVPIIGVLHP